MEPIYKIISPDNQNIQFTADLSEMWIQLEKVEKGSFRKFLAYMEESYSSFTKAYRYIKNRNFYTAAEFFNPQNFYRIARLKGFCNHYSYT